MNANLGKLLMCVAGAFLVGMPAAQASNDFHAWAPTPPMGWNSWDSLCSMANEDEMKRNADAQAELLLPYGYDYCVLDIRWTVQNETPGYNQKDPVYTLDEYGRYLPAPNRFPSGMKPLADYIHAKGLKFGIHIMRGVPKEAVARKLPVKGANGITCDQITDGKVECAWLRDNCTVLKDRPGAQAYYDSIMELYASWGVDFIKCDDLSAPVYHQDEVEMLRKAIDKCGRPMILSTSPGETPLAAADHLTRNANMWRMVNDMWDKWGDLKHLLPIACDWLKKPHVAGCWPDCDMIPVGRLCLKYSKDGGRCRLTKDEQVFLMTLFATVRSPLIVGADLPSLKDDPWTLQLLTNPEVLKMHREANGVKVIRCDKEGAELTATLPDGTVYRAIFNLHDNPVTYATAAATEVWTGTFANDYISVPAHGAVLLKPAEEPTATTVTVDTAKVVSPTSPDLWGIFFEDIDLSLDGGVYAEMIRNRSFEDFNGKRNELTLEYWNPVGGAELCLDASKPLSPQNRHCCRVRGAAGAGLANEGYFGMGVKKGMTYNLEIALRGDASVPPGGRKASVSSVEVALEAYGKPTLATATIMGVTGEWQTFRASLVANADDPQARLVVRMKDLTGEGLGELFVDNVSLFPADAVAGLFRKDLMEKLAALKPSFVRFPGGCWVEGKTMAEAYRWKTTIGDKWNRRTQWNIWKYWSTNGVGFHEYLLLAEALGAKPLFCINVGMSHTETVPMEKMGEFVQDALDCLEYANGPVDSPWGAKRAAAGHPAPFNLAYLEIGNENGGPDYEARYALVAKAVHEKYPNVKLVFDHWKSTWRVNDPKDLRDDHFYSSPDRFMGKWAHEYDSPRGDFGIFVGEYAVTEGTTRYGSLRAAIGEAAFMTALERHQDQVKLAAYAPLFANAQHTVWTPNLIYPTTDGSFVHPSWNVQKLFSENRGAEVLDIAVKTPVFETTLPAKKGAVETNRIATVQASAVRTADGTVIVKLVNCAEHAEAVSLGLVGRSLRDRRAPATRTVFTGPDRDAHNSPCDREALKEVTDTLTLGDEPLVLPPLSLTVLRIERTPAAARHFNPIVPDWIADPSICRFGDTFYLYGTTDIDAELTKAGVPVVWKSKDFVNWSFEGPAMTGIDWTKGVEIGKNRDGSPKLGYWRYWAPGKVIQRGDKYCLYVTIVSPDGKKMPTKMFVADRPEGPWDFNAGVEVAPDIDGDPFVDDDGANYLVWRRRHAAKLNAEGTAIEGETVELPTRQKGYSEGPFLFKRNGIYYHCYTIGGCDGYRYHYMMSRESPLAGWTEPPNGDLVVESNPAADVWGPGHGNSFAVGDQRYLCYLEYGEGGTTRQVFVNEMDFRPDGTIIPVEPNRTGVGSLSPIPGEATSPSLHENGEATSSSLQHLATWSATSTQPPRNVIGRANKGKVLRTATYDAANVADRDNATRWMAAADDQTPTLTADFGAPTPLGEMKIFFTKPAFGQNWKLEGSLDGTAWTPLAEETQQPCRSPHVAKIGGTYRYLRLTITAGDRGVWEIQVY